MSLRRLVICSLGLYLSSLCASASATATIKILTSYDANVLSAWGVANITYQVNTQIANLNTAFANTGIDAVVQSVGIVPFDSTGVTSIIDMPAAGQQSTTLRLRRDLAGADVVMMLGFYGIAAGQALQIGSTANTAFAAVDISDLPYYGYQHEFGHLLGAHHQLTGGVSNNDSTGGAAHGAYIRVIGSDPGAGGASSPLCLQTIMAYTPVDNLADVSCTSNRVLWYSTPSAANSYSDAIWNAGNPSFGGDFRNTTFANYSNGAAMISYVPVVATYHVTKLAGGAAGIIMSILANLLMTDP